MNPTHFHRIAKDAAASVSRRRLLRGVAATALAGVAWPDRWREIVSGKSALAPAASDVILPYTPHLTPRFPVPLGGSRFLMNGRVVTVDLDRATAAFRAGAATVPVVVDEAIYEITPALVARATQQATPVATPAADSPPLDRQLLEKILNESLETTCGEFDESQDVEFYDGVFPQVTFDFVMAHQPMAALLKWKGNLKNRYDNWDGANGVRHCSGTLIADNLFLTAGHCITPGPKSEHKLPWIKGTQTPISKEECARNMEVVFNYQLDLEGQSRATRTVDVIALKEHQKSESLDYAILQLDGTPGQDFGVASIAADDPPPGSPICIIGHPLGQEKRIAGGTAANTAFNWILYDDLDTVGGTSGSGILRTPGGPLVGLHLGGRCDDADDDDDAGNQGTNLGLSIRALLPESEILRDLAQ